MLKQDGERLEVNQMYSYSWDSQTGGILLNSSPLKSSNEPRPVYYKELDLLGFDKFWKYDKNDTYPYLWSELNNYYYRGKLVAKVKGGSVYSKPELLLIDEPEPNSQKLRYVDVPAMVSKNYSILESLVQDTIKKIYNTYSDYSKKIDVFYVAFSGGKDSIVTLDLVQRALPHNCFKVLFGDTGMEFPDTYTTVEQVYEKCKSDGIDFIITKADQGPKDSWVKFGPPATVTRWCCSVHKTAPQILKLRDLTNKPNFTGMAFIGVRASESAARNEYDYLSLGEKHKGQFSCNPILEWNSAELYLYLYSRGIPISEVYKKGNKRAGCLVCPRAAERNEYFAHMLYPSEFDSLLDLIKQMYRNNFSSEEKLNEFIDHGGWKARKNGRDLSLALNYRESVGKEYTTIFIEKPKSDWKEWIKTIGVLVNSESPYKIDFKGNILDFEVKEVSVGLEVQFSNELTKTHTAFTKMLKSVMHKTACCVACNSCAADCHNGCIVKINGKIHITDNCVHCAQCHKVEKGCWIFKSLELPSGGIGVSSTKSLNCYSHHAPKLDWFNQYFQYKQDFEQNHTLGSQMYSFFKRFLKDAELLDKTGFSTFAEHIDKIGLSEHSSWGLMLVNLSYSPQINWVVKRIPFYEECNKDYVQSLLISDGADEKWVGDVWNSIARILELPFNSVGFGRPIKDHSGLEKSKTIAFERVPWSNPDSRVILYSLYKFAEACGDYYQFTLSRLYDYSIKSDGVSPAEIFGIDKSNLEKILVGLASNYPELITSQFTLDLDTISLNSSKTSLDILKLFE